MGADETGSLQFSKLRPALKLLQDNAKQAENDALGLREQADRRVAKSKAVGEAVIATESFEMEDARVENISKNPTVGVQLGVLLMKKNLKIGEVLKAWDGDGDGTVTRKEFRVKVIDMGVQAHPLDIDRFFDSYDNDGGGSLDLEEVKKTFTKLHGVAIDAERELKDLKKEVDRLRKEAGKHHAQVAAMRARDAREKKEAEDAARIRAEQQVAAELEAKRIAAEAAEAAARAKQAKMEALAAKGKERLGGIAR